MKRILLLLLICSPFVLLQPAQAESATVTKLAQAFSPDQSSLNLSLTTPEGRHQFNLQQVHVPAPSVSIAGNLTSVASAEQPLLYSGLLRKRSYETAAPKFVSADYFKGRLRVNFTGRRGRLFQAIFEEGQLVGRLKHFPRNLSIHLHGKHSVKPKDLVATPAINARAINLGKDVDLGIEVDFELFQRLGSDVALVNAEVLAMINRVNSIYRGQVGLRLLVQSINVWNVTADPYTSSVAITRLEQFRNYTRSNKQISGDIKHLFTGVDIAVDDDSSVVGLAYRGTVCRSNDSAFSMSERLSQLLQPIVTAHEIGHNFNCGHDDETTSLMSSVVSSSQTNFSDASLEEIEDFVSADSSCLATTSSTPVKPNLALTVKVQNKTKLVFQLTPSLASAESCTIFLYGASSTSKLSGTYRQARLLTDIVGSPRDIAVAVSTGELTQKASGNTYYRGVVKCGTHTATTKVIRVRSTSMRGKRISIERFLSYLKEQL